MTSEEPRANCTDAVRWRAARGRGSNEAIQKQSGRLKRRTASASKWSAQENKMRRAVEEQYDVEAIVRHESVANVIMEVKTKGHKLKWQLNKLRTISPARTAFLAYREGFPSKPTWELDEHLNGVEVYEEYCAKNCPGLQRYFLSAPDTLSSTLIWLSGQRRPGTFSHTLLEVTAKDNYSLDNGNEAIKEFLDRARENDQSARQNSEFDVGRKLVYMILDADMLPPDAADCSFQTFGNAGIYFGKGEEKRPFHHLEKAKKALLEGVGSTTTDCEKRIAAIWLTGGQVLVMPVIAKIRDEEAITREAALISLKNIGLRGLTNKVGGKCKGHEHWTPIMKEQLGVLELQRAFKSYSHNRMLALGPQDIPLSEDLLSNWHALCVDATSNETTLEEAGGAADASETMPVTVGLPDNDGRENYCFFCNEDCDSNTVALVYCAECQRIEV